MRKAKDIIVMKNEKVVNHQKGVQETKPQEAKTPAKEEAESQGSRAGEAVAKKFQELDHRLAKVEEGWRQFMDQVSYSNGFHDGRRYIVSQAERILCEQTGCKTREELMLKEKLPNFWISTLVLCLDDPPNVLPLTKNREDKKQ